MAGKTRLLFKILALCTLLSPIVIWGAWNDGIGGENGYFVPNGGNTDIRHWTGCKNVSAAACPGSGVFVPTKTAPEWLSFISAGGGNACVTVSPITCY